MKVNWKKGKATLALGEVSGHSHRFDNDVSFVANDVGLATQILLEKPTNLIHEEHEAILVPEGEYEVRIQQEYDVIEGVRQVLD